MPNSREAFIEAIYQGDAKKVKTIITANTVDINQPTRRGDTPLYIAAQMGYIEIVNALITAGANVDQPTSFGVTPLYIAAQGKDKDIVDALITAGANVDQADNCGETPLYIAAQERYKDIVDALITAGANVDQADNCGATPLYIAAQERYKDIVDALITAGANVDQADNCGETPLYIAAQNGHNDIVKTLLCWGANSTVKPYGNTPLQAAFVNNQYDVVVTFNKFSIYQSHVTHWVNDNHQLIVKLSLQQCIDAISKTDDSGLDINTTQKARVFCRALEASMQRIVNGKPNEILSSYQSQLNELISATRRAGSQNSGSYGTLFNSTNNQSQTPPIASEAHDRQCSNGGGAGGGAGARAML